MTSSSAKWTSVLAVGVLTGAGLVAVSGQPALAAPLNSCQQVDNGDPAYVLGSLTTSPIDIDVSAVATRVTFGANATDTGTDGIPNSTSGVGYVELEISPPGNRPHRFVRLPAAGTTVVSGSMALPRGSASGTWNIVGLKVVDRAGNSRAYSQDDLPVEESAFHVSSPSDTTPPTVSRLSLSTTKVDTTRKARRVAIAAKVSDAAAGVASVVVSVQRPPFGQVLRIPLRHVRATIYRGTLRIPRWVGNARWLVTALHAEDRVLNTRALTRAQLSARGYPTRIRVRSGDESRRPRVTDFRLTPSAVDLTSGDVLVRVQATARDNLSGVVAVGVRFQNDEIGTSRDPVSLRRVSGTARAGVWRGTLRLSRCHNVFDSLRPEVDVRDAASNGRFYENLPAGWSTGLTITNFDNQPPFVNSLPGQVLFNGSVDVGFNELVEGVGPDTVVVEPLDDQFEVSGPPVPGTWTCPDAPNDDCTAGPVLSATFTPSSSFTNARYIVQLNPEGVLGLTDLAGNAPRRSVQAGFNVSFPP